MSRQKIIGWSRAAAFWLFWPALALVIWGEVIPATGIEIHAWDKLLHFLAYFGLSALAYRATGGGRKGIWAAAALAFLGGILEIVQGMVGRDMSFWDEVANTLGAATGALVAEAYLRLRPTIHRLLGAPDAK
ncbi:MAG: hypothetical protein GC166_03975 [Alphaproteobacteria bacterium]|nr:hypothetical protein [Alphaproteobacteria bacterium]